MSLFDRRTFGIQARLTMFAAVTALPLVVVASLAILQTIVDQRTQMRQNLRNQVENLLADVDRQISAVQAVL